MQGRKKAAADQHKTVYSFLQTSGLSEKCRTEWSDLITACKPYEYICKSEFLKLLNTHPGGCFASSQEYTRFRAFVNEWQGEDSCCSGGGEAAAAAAAAGTTDDDHEFRRSTGDDGCSCRSFAPPHPSTGRRRSSGGGGDSGIHSEDNKSKPLFFDTGDDTTANTGDDDNGGGVITTTETPSQNTIDQELDQEQRKRHKFYLTTGFMQHGICGLHKWTIIAKDIHKDTNTLMYHKREYDSRDVTNNIIKSHDYMMIHSPGKDPSSSRSRSRPSKLQGNKNSKRQNSKKKTPPPAAKHRKRKASAAEDEEDAAAIKRIKHMKEEEETDTAAAASDPDDYSSSNESSGSDDDEAQQQTKED